jgi:hypothetical protein
LFAVLFGSSDPSELVIFDVNMLVSAPGGSFLPVIKCVTTLASKDSETSCTDPVEDVG